MKIQGAALILFICAFCFYFLGFASAAIGFSIIGILFELAAWVSLFSKGENEKKNESSDVES